MAQQSNTHILILIHSDQGTTYELAKEIKLGIEKNKHAEGIIKLVKQSTLPALSHIPVASVNEMPAYDGIIFGSPVYFGNISTAMSEFLAKTVPLWTAHALEGIPAGVFMAAGSGAGKELAMQSFYNSLATHGMLLVTNGIRGNNEIDSKTPNGNTILGAGSLNNAQQPTASERKIANLQGEHFAKVAAALQGKSTTKITQAAKPITIDVSQRLIANKISLPNAPAPVGNYTPYSITGNLVFINQVALKDGKILNPGKVGESITEEEAIAATKKTLLNVVAVLKTAVGGDLNRVKRCVQLTGYFNTTTSFTNHALLMNPASDLAVAIFGDKGKHARATVGVNSLPLNSSVEIAAVFEIE